MLILEATRRATGWALPITALVFLAYGLTFGNQSLGIMLDQLYLTTEGIFGIPIYVSATYVMLFILFGSFVERSGAGQLFMDFALALAGSSSGGPAKVAVITSSLFGTVSGSAVANVMTTGTFTIPLMKRTGYRPAFAGAVEAVASTGGQLMPPIMGAAAFVMAEFLGVSYLTVAGFALLPAILYYVAVFMAVHFEAKRIGLVGVPKADLPRPEGRAARARPPVPAAGRHRRRAAGRPQRRLRRRSAASARSCRRPGCAPARAAPSPGARSSRRSNPAPATRVIVALACASAGIVIGTITLTGLGLSFTGVVLALSQNSAILAAGADDGRRHPARHGPADDAGLHRPGRAAGAGAGQARHPRRGGAPVRPLLRRALGDHAAGGDGGLRRQRHLAARASWKRAGRR